MAINISEQFIVNVALPVDSRIVASNSTALNAIAFKYDGLKVFQQDTRETYVWNESLNNWILEGVSGSGENNNVLKWNGGLTSSNISSIGQFVGINTNNPVANLQIDGTGQPFVIQKDNGTIIAHNWYNDGSDQFFNNSSGSGAIKFRDIGEVWILTRSGSSTAINSANGNFTNASAVFRPDSISLTKDTTFNTDNSAVSSARIRATNSFSTATDPDYTWFGNDQTGFYHPVNNVIGITVGGAQRAIINTTGFLLSQNTSISGPAARLHIDNISGSSYVKFTAGAITGVGSNDGFDIGIYTSGNPIIKNNEGNNLLISFKSNSNISHYLNSNEFVMFADSDGIDLSSISTSSRVITGTNKALKIGNGSIDVEQLSVPNDCYFSIEATFTNVISSYYRTTKIMYSYFVSGSGFISLVNIGTTPATNTIFDRHNLSATTYIGDPTIDVSTSNTVKLQQSFGNTSFGNNSGRSLVSFTVAINKP